MQPSFDDTASFSQAALAAVIAARLELITFVCGVVVYAILVLAPKRFQYKDALGKKLKAKLAEPAEDAKDSPKWIEHADKTMRETSTNNRSATVARAQKDMKSSSVDVAKHIVMMRKHASENNLKSVMNVFESLKESGVELNSIIYNTVFLALVSEPGFSKFGILS